MKTFNTIAQAQKYSEYKPNEITKCKWFYSNSKGHIKKYCFYLNGKQHGECMLFDINGTLEVHCFYLNNKPHGEFKWFYRDGNLIKHCFYLNGKEQSHLQYLTTERDETTLTLLFGENYI